MTRLSFALLALLATLSAACSRITPVAEAPQADPLVEPQIDPHRPVALRQETPPQDRPARRAATNPRSTCASDSDCAAGEQCVSRIDYGGCEECDGGYAIQVCEAVDACPTAISCEPGAENPRCTDPSFRQRCPNTKFGL